jgi:hypothetical protein
MNKRNKMRQKNKVINSKKKKNKFKEIINRRKKMKVIIFVRRITLKNQKPNKWRKLSQSRMILISYLRKRKWRREINFWQWNHG